MGTYQPASFLTDRLNGDDLMGSRVRRGSAPHNGQDVVPHILSFQSLVSSLAKVYRDADEATKASLDNARWMRNDVGIMECLEARQRCVSLLDWSVVPEDERDGEQVELCQKLTKILLRIRRFTEYRRCLMEAAWYGKSAIQNRYGWQMVDKVMRLLPTPRHADDHGWRPIHGDKLTFRFDDGSLDAAKGQVANQMGLRVRLDMNDENVEIGDRSRVRFLRPEERRTFTVHKHMLEDAAFEDAMSAGAIHGVGIRSRIYWEWVQKQESLAFLMEYLERSAGGIEVWSYPQGNDKAKREAEDAATQRLGGARNVVLVPKPMGDDLNQYGVQIIEPGMAGIEQLTDLVKSYFGHRIKRYILGQTLTSEADATGLGSGVADAHMDTFMQIVQYDAANLEETLTFELLHPVKDFNFPWAKGINCRIKLAVEKPDIKDKLDAYQAAYQMGCSLKERDVMDMIGAAIPGPDDRVLQMPQQGGQPGVGGGGVAPGAGMDQQQFEAAFTKAGQSGGQSDEQTAKPVSRYQRWNEEEHPRGQPDNAGQFAEKTASSEQAPTVEKVGIASRPAGGKYKSIPVVDETIKTDGVEADSNGMSLIIQSMTDEELSEMSKLSQEFADSQRDEWIRDELGSYDPDDDIDFSEFEDDEDDDRLDEARQELRDAKRERLEESFDYSSVVDDYENGYMEEFYQSHKHETRFAGGYTKLNTWGKDQDGDFVYGFQTSSGRGYHAWLGRSGPQHGVDEPIPLFGFHDDDESYGITGAGNAREVFTSATNAALALITSQDLPAIYFSAEEPSRQRLYDRLVKSVAAELPGYAAIAAMLPSGGKGYVVALREKVSEFVARANQAGQTHQILVSYSRRASAQDIRWVPVEPESNPSWFTSDEEWREFDPPPPNSGTDSGDGGSAKPSPQPQPTGHGGNRIAAGQYANNRWRDQPRAEDGTWSKQGGPSDRQGSKATVAAISIAGDGRPEDKREAMAAGMRLRGVYRNANTGWDIHLYRAGIAECVFRRGLDFRAIPVLPAIIQNAVLVGSEQSGRGEQDAVAVHYLAMPINIDGQAMVVRLVVKEGEDQHYKVDRMVMYSASTKRIEGPDSTPQVSAGDQPAQLEPNEPLTEMSIDKLRTIVNAKWKSGGAEQYARRKPSSRQKQLIGDEQEDIRWVTIGGHEGEGGGKHHGGTPVKIDKKGNILAGPKALADQGIKNLKDFGKKPSPAQHQPGLFEPDEDLGGQRRLALPEPGRPAKPVAASTADDNERPEATSGKNESHWDSIRMVRTQRFGTIAIGEALWRLRDGQTLGVGGNHVVTGIYPDGRETSLKGSSDGFSNMAGSLVIGQPREADDADEDDDPKSTESVTSSTGRQFVLHPYVDADEPHELVSVDPMKLDASWTKDLGYVPPGGEDVKGRREGVKKFLETNKPIEASKVRLHERTGEVSFSDGRHRFAVLRDLGEPDVAMSVPSTQAEEFRRRFGPGSGGQDALVMAMPASDDQSVGKVSGGRGRFDGVTSLDDIKSRLKPGEKLSFATYGGGTQAEKQADDGPKDGDRNDDGLVFRDGRWRRESLPGETPAEQSSVTEDPNAAATTRMAADDFALHVDQNVVPHLKASGVDALTTSQLAFKAKREVRDAVKGQGSIKDAIASAFNRFDHWAGKGGAEPVPRPVDSKQQQATATSSGDIRFQGESITGAFAKLKQMLEVGRVSRQPKESEQPEVAEPDPQEREPEQQGEPSTNRLPEQVIPEKPPENQPDHGEAEPQSISDSEPSEQPEPPDSKPHRMHVNDLHVDPSRFQYKFIGVGSSGVTKELKQAGAYNPMLGGQLLVWTDPGDGKTYVVNGHHRHDLAKRTVEAGKQDGWDGTMPVFHLNSENDAQARAMGAITNIAEGRGTVVDAAKFLRDSGKTIDDLTKYGVSPNGALARDSAILAKLSPIVWNKVAQELVTPGRGVAIAKHLGHDKDAQDELMKIVEDRDAKRKEPMTDGQVDAMAREMAMTPKAEADSGGLFGDFFERSLLPERAELKDAVSRVLAAERNAFQAVSSKRRSSTLEAAGNQLDTGANRERAKSTDQHLEDFHQQSNWVNHPIAAAVNEAAERLSREPRKASRIKSELIEQVRQLLTTAPDAEGRHGDSEGDAATDRGGSGDAAERRYARIHSRAAGIQRYQAWKEAEHPRGQPANSGQFAEKAQNSSAGDDRLTHRRRSEALNPGHVMQFKDEDAVGVSNESYGPHVWVLLDDLPLASDDEQLIEMAMEYFSTDREGAIEAIDPPDIVDSAGAWDDVGFVSDVWQRHGRGESTLGFRTQNGAVILDQESANLRYEYDDPERYSRHRNAGVRAVTMALNALVAS